MRPLRASVTQCLILHDALGNMRAQKQRTRVLGGFLRCHKSAGGCETPPSAWHRLYSCPPEISFVRKPDSNTRAGRPTLLCNLANGVWCGLCPISPLHLLDSAAAVVCMYLQKSLTFPSALDFSHAIQARRVSFAADVCANVPRMKIVLAIFALPALLFHPLVRHGRVRPQFACLRPDRSRRRRAREKLSADSCSLPGNMFPPSPALPPYIPWDD